MNFTFSPVLGHEGLVRRDPSRLSHPLDDWRKTGLLVSNPGAIRRRKTSPWPVDPILFRAGDQTTVWPPLSRLRR